MLGKPEKKSCPIGSMENGILLSTFSRFLMVNVGKYTIHGSVDRRNAVNSPVEVGSFVPIIYGVLAPSQVVGNGSSFINSMTRTFYVRKPLKEKQQKITNRLLPKSQMLEVGFCDHENSSLK